MSCTSCKSNCNSCSQSKPCGSPQPHTKCCSCKDAVITKTVNCEGKHITELPRLLNISSADLVYVYDVSKGESTQTTILDLVSSIMAEVEGGLPLDPGVYGDPSSVSVVTVNAEGFISNITEVPIALAMDDLTDVNSTGILNGQLLQFDGSNYVPVTLANIAFTGDFADLTGVPAFITGADGVNVGAGAEVYKDNADANTLRFRTIEGGGNIVVTQNTDVIRIEDTPLPYPVQYQYVTQSWNDLAVSDARTMWMYNVPPGVWLFMATVTHTIATFTRSMNVSIVTSAGTVAHTNTWNSTAAHVTSTFGITLHHVVTIPSIENVSVVVTVGSGSGTTATARLTALKLA